MLLRVAIGFLLTSALTLAARQPPAAPPAGQETARFGAATAGVIVDAVARDKHGRPVTDLSPAEFEIYEDGVLQQIVAFEPYTPEDGPKTVVEAARVAGVGTGKATTRRLSEGPPVIALAWDRLEPEGRALAHQAAKRLVETKAPGELVGVFLTDDQPDRTGAPPKLDFSSAQSRDFDKLEPQVKQIFFIGDGLNSAGKRQEFIVPPGATRLYLATWDFYEWNNNSGQRTVKVSRPEQVILMQ